MKIIPKDLMEQGPVARSQSASQLGEASGAQKGRTEETASNGVRAALESLSTQDQPVAAASSAVPMDTQLTRTASTEKDEKKEKKMLSPLLQAKLRHIKPLLNVTSRLGKALSEFFGILVKFCVGSSSRQRRLQANTAPPPPSALANKVIESVAKLLISGLRWKPPVWSPVPKLHLTFFICATGFVAPMVFDEKKQPYHAMLHKFEQAGGLEALHESFSWALQSRWSAQTQDGDSADELPSGTGEFLDSWLMLAEKMVNVKLVLESPHTLTSGNNSPTKSSPFNALRFLIKTHKMAFDAVMLLWGKPPIKTFGRWMAEAVLSILCEIIKGHSVIKVRTASYSFVFTR